MKTKKTKFNALVWMRIAHIFVVVKLKAESADEATSRAKSLAKSYNAKFIELVN